MPSFQAASGHLQLQSLDLRWIQRPNYVTLYYYEIVSSIYVDLNKHTYIHATLMPIQTALDWVGGL